MNRSLRYGIAVVAMGFAITIASPVEARSQNILGEILRRMDLHNASLKTMTAGVTMVKTNTQLGDSDTTIGTTSYISKAVNGKLYVRIDWTKPVEEQVSLIGDDYELYRPRLNQVIYGKSQKSKNVAPVGGALGFLSMSKDQLKANYNVSYLGEEQINGGTKTWHLQLAPKTATSYKNAELWVDGDGMPRQAKVTESNDDTTTVLLSNISKNPTLKGNMFKLSYPGSVKRIKG